MPDASNSSSESKTDALNPLELSPQAEEAYQSSVSLGAENGEVYYKPMEESKRFGLFVRPGEELPRKAREAGEAVGASPNLLEIASQLSAEETERLEKADAAADSTLLALEEEEEFEQHQEKEMARLSAEIEAVEEALNRQESPAEPPLDLMDEPDEAEELTLEIDEEPLDSAPEEVWDSPDSSSSQPAMEESEAFPEEESEAFPEEVESPSEEMGSDLDKLAATPEELTPLPEDTREEPLDAGLSSALEEPVEEPAPLESLTPEPSQSAPQAPELQGSNRPVSGARAMTEITPEELEALIPLQNQPPATEAPSKPGPPPKRRLNFLEKLALLLIAGTVLLAGVLVVGGYLRILDSSLLHQLVRGYVHQLEFTAAPQTRLVQNAYIRQPLLVIEGSVRNLFGRGEEVGAIRLKGVALDGEGRLLESGTGYAGTLFSDEELKSMSRGEIELLLEQPSGREEQNWNLETGQEVPFQIVLFETGAEAQNTMVQMVSYERNGETVYVQPAEQSR